MECISVWIKGEPSSKTKYDIWAIEKVPWGKGRNRNFISSSKYNLNKKNKSVPFA